MTSNDSLNQCQTILPFVKGNDMHSNLLIVAEIASGILIEADGIESRVTRIRPS